MPKDSLAKVLNVVKPPQKPVTSSSFISGDSTPLLTKPTKSPISREPRILTAKVPQGNEVFREDIRYLNTDPTAPPNATNNRFLIIFNCNFAAKVRKIGQNYVFLPQQNRFSVKKWLGNSNIAVASVAAIISDYGTDILVPSARVRCFRLEKKSFGSDKSKSLTC